MKLTSMITEWTLARVGQPPYHITLPNMVISSVIRPENTVGSSLYTAHGPQVDVMDCTCMCHVYTLKRSV